MSKYFWINILIFGVTVLLSFIAILAFITQAFNFDLVSIQWLYGVLDRTWGMIRAIIMLLISLGGFLILIYYKRKKVEGKSLTLGLIIAFVGLVLGLLVFYDRSCCDTPIVFYLGFPLSWLRGMTNSTNSLQLPIAPFLFQNLRQIIWYIDTFSLIMDILLGYVVGVIVFIFVKKNNKTIPFQKRTEFNINPKRNSAS
jgi:hypothetical protein